MALKKISGDDLAGKGVLPLQDVPGLSGAAMRQKFEEVVREVVIPALNENAGNTYDKHEVKSQIAQAVFDSDAADMAKAVYDPGNMEGDAFAAAKHRLDTYRRADEYAPLEETDSTVIALGKLEAGLLEKARDSAAAAEREEGDLQITSRMAPPVGQVNYAVSFDMPEGGFDPSGGSCFIDGVQVELRDSGGEPMAGALPGNVPAWLERRGNVAFFKQGGAGANYDVVGGTTRPEGKENRIWVNTDVAIPHYGIADNIPMGLVMPWGELAMGDVIILSGGPSYGFVAYKGNRGGLVSPRYVYQWDGAQWLPQKARLYSGGNWMPITMLYYDNGTEYVAFEQYGTNYPIGGNTFTKDPDRFTLTSPYGPGSGYYAVAFGTSERLDISDLQSITIEVPKITMATQKKWLVLHDSKVIAIHGDAPASPQNAIASRTIDAMGETEFDVSGITGSYYIAVYLVSSSSPQTLEITQISGTLNSG